MTYGILDPEDTRADSSAHIDPHLAARKGTIKGVYHAREAG